MFKKNTWPYKGQKKEQNLGSAPQDRVGRLYLTSSSSQICLPKQLIKICHKPLVLVRKISCKKKKNI